MSNQWYARYQTVYPYVCSQWYECYGGCNSCQRNGMWRVQHACGSSGSGVYQQTTRVSLRIVHTSSFVAHTFNEIPAAAGGEPTMDRSPQHDNYWGHKAHFSSSGSICDEGGAVVIHTTPPCSIAQVKAVEVVIPAVAICCAYAIPPLLPLLVDDGSRRIVRIRTMANNCSDSNDGCCDRRDGNGNGNGAEDDGINMVVTAKRWRCCWRWCWYTWCCSWWCTSFIIAHIIPPMIYTNIIMIYMIYASTRWYMLYGQ